LDAEWTERCGEIISEEFSYRYSKQYDGLDLISIVYDRVKSLFGSILQVTQSSLLSPSISFGKESISRPVYSRLPGIAEGYRSDPSFSDVETPTQWLVSGTDEFLSKKKDSIASFYADYLDPDTCSPALLDWLAQHVGLFGDLWNELWDDKVKRALIKNSFGWWDRESSVDVPALGNVLTAKGSALEKFPFTQSEWALNTETTAWGGSFLSWNSFSTWSGHRDNLLNIKLDEIETIRIENNVIVPSQIFKVKTYSETSGKMLVFSTDTARINKLLWNGLIEAKGSLLGIAFLSSVFGLKAHSPAELQIVDAERKIFKPKTGLRNVEVSAPVLLPYKQNVLQVGSPEDASVNNYTNQLVAGVSMVSSVTQSNNVFFRVPYYYNRDGKSWDRASYIAKNWMPSNLNVRVQYPYLSADLWAVGDAFFEPKVVEI
jgi:phage tail P2-like protein